jgi:hypothetical protein
MENLCTSKRKDYAEANNTFPLLTLSNPFHAKLSGFGKGYFSQINGRKNKVLILFTFSITNLSILPFYFPLNF